MKECFQKNGVSTEALDKEIECSKLENVDLRYGCLGNDKTSKYFCAEKYVTVEDVQKCLEDNDLEKKGDKFMDEKMLLPYYLTQVFNET